MKQQNETDKIFDKMGMPFKRIISAFVLNHNNIKSAGSIKNNDFEILKLWKIMRNANMIIPRKDNDNFMLNEELMSQFFPKYNEVIERGEKEGFSKVEDVDLIRNKPDLFIPTKECMKEMINMNVKMKEEIEKAKEMKEIKRWKDFRGCR